MMTEQASHLDWTAARPGRTYWALTSLSGHSADSPYVTVCGSHYGVVADPTAPRRSGGNVFTTRAAAETHQAALPEGSMGAKLPIMRVTWHGGSVFTRAEEGNQV